MSNNISSSSNRVEDDDQSVKEWSSTQHVSFYLNKAANVPQRTEGEAILFDLIPKDVKRKKQQEERQHQQQENSDNSSGLPSIPMPSAEFEEYNKQQMAELIQLLRRKRRGSIGRNNQTIEQETK